MLFCWLDSQFDIVKSNIFKRVKYYPYKVQLVHELADNGFDRWTLFRGHALDQSNKSPEFKNNLFSDILFKRTRIQAKRSLLVRLNPRSRFL